MVRQLFYYDIAHLCCRISVFGCIRLSAMHTAAGCFFLLFSLARDVSTALRRTSVKKGACSQTSATAHDLIKSGVIAEIPGRSSSLVTESISSSITSHTILRACGRIHDQSFCLPESVARIESRIFESFWLPTL